MSKGKVAILGINGHVGQAAAKGFVAAGWQVTGMGRTDKHRLPGVRFQRGDSDSVADMQAAIGDSDVVVNALNLPYHTWFGGRMEAQMARVVEAMGRSGKTMLFPGNIYNFGAELRDVLPDSPQNPVRPRGALRKRVEEAFRRAAEAGGVQIIILRAGDFFGPQTSMDWFDQGMFSEIKKGKVWLLGKRGVGHSWAYLPDLGRAFEALASLRGTLGAFERFHYAGYFVTPEDMQGAIARVAPHVRFAMFPWIMLRLIGLFDPLMREIGKMGYLWTHPMELRDERLDSLLGPGFGTPFAEAVAATSLPFITREAEGKGALAAAE
ncbi:MAG TPA: NAD-dependent epimerase/dehydratase family protein [Devosia sp.]|nr:NAD-dependent epimerase/dehydratase family protein [Devosia sp.]